MRIAQVAPLYESVPPKLYGGTERIVSYLTEELVAQGLEVTLFASGDSLTKANLVPICPTALRLNPECIDPLTHHLVMLQNVFSRRDDFDIIHFHVDYLHFPLSRLVEWTTVTTLHGRLDIPDLVPLYRVFSEMPVSSISDAQREPLPWLNWQGTVYHGLPSTNYEFSSKPKGYLAFLGRMSPEKGPERAIEIAKRVGMPIKIGAKVDKVDMEYFNACVKPLLDHPLVEFLGELGYPEKNELLGGAEALLFPICWPEPFGIVMIEALACGTPVIAYPNGSVSEVIEDGVSGLLVSGIDSAVEAVRNIDRIDRAMCRRRFDERFTATRMSAEYLCMYEALLRPHGETLSTSDGVPIG
jgi:glycosyltransferase involved in cell wall biosynthesis